MGFSKGIPWPESLASHVKNSPDVYTLVTGIVFPVLVAALSLVALRFLGVYISEEKKKKFWGVPVKIEGPGVAYRHRRYLGFLTSPHRSARTVPSLFELAVQTHAAKPVLGVRKLISRELENDPATGRALEKLTLGNYEWQTYLQVHERVVRFSSGLMELGHPLDRRVAIFAETRPEWFIALQASFRQSLVVVTVYASLGQDALIHSLNETEVSTLICDSKQLPKIKESIKCFPTLKLVIYMEEQGESLSLPDSSEDSPIKFISFSQVEALGAKKDEKTNFPSSENTAVIMYTSGSTGMPKGVMMSHGNLVAAIAGVLSIIPNLNPSDVYLAYLPLAHVLELVAEVGLSYIGVAIGYGSPLTLNDSIGKIKKGTKGDLSVLKPTLFAAVPAILDRVRDGVRKKIDSLNGYVKSLFDLAYCRRIRAIEEGAWNSAWGLEKLFWDFAVFSKIRAIMGGKVRFILSGGAPLSSDTQRFINTCFGVPVGQGYGLTETCAGGTVSEFDDTSVGRVGPPIPSCYVKLIDWGEGGYLTSDEPLARGEICIGGNNVTQGYFKNEQKTNEVYHVDARGIRWFHTGDIGRFHPDGVLEIVDRKKDIVKLQAGEYVSLGKVESAMQASPYVNNFMLHANSLKNFTVALVVPNHAALSKWAQANGLGELSFPDLVNRSEAIAEVLKSLNKVGKEARLERFELPAKIKLLPEAWTPESGLVTAALKLKREALNRTFEKELKELYTD